MVKSAGVQRESDGVVVPVIGVQQNAPGGKGRHHLFGSGRGYLQFGGEALARQGDRQSCDCA
jgi:RNA-directed DNA polymerase